MTDRNREGGTFERVGESMGEAAGKMAGRMADTAFNATGALFNSMASMLGSWWSSANASQAADSFSGRETACREHHQARSASGTSRRDYESSRPLYQFGHVAGQNPDYQGRSFSEVEPELRRAWETGGTNEYGSWDDVRDYVGYGFGQGTGSPGLETDTAQGGAASGRGTGAGAGGMNAGGETAGSGDMNASGRVSGSLDLDDTGVHGHVDFGGAGGAGGSGGAQGGSRGGAGGSGGAQGGSRGEREQGGNARGSARDTEESRGSGF